MALSAPGHRIRRLPSPPPRRVRTSDAATRRRRCTGLSLLALSAVAIGACGGSDANAGGVAAVAQGAQAYVCNFAYQAHPGMTITPIDLSGPRTEHRVTVGSLPSALAATPGGAELAVTTRGDDHLVLLDTSSNTVVGRVTTGLEPDAVAITPDGKTAVVANFGAGTVNVVDLATFRTDKVVAVGSQPDAVAITPDGKTAVVANFGAGTVSLVDLSTMTAAAPVAVGPGPSAVVVSGAAGEGVSAWVGVGTTLVPVSLSRPAAGPAVAVGHLVEAVALGDGGRTAWIASQGGAVFPVTLSNGHVGKSATVAGQPSAIAVAPPSP